MAAHRWLRPLPLRVGALLGALGAIVAVALWWTGRTDGRAHIIVPPLAGDGLLLKSAGGQIALIDGGANGSAVASWLGKEVALGRPQVDPPILARGAGKGSGGEVWQAGDGVGGGRGRGSRCGRLWHVVLLV